MDMTCKRTWIWIRGATARKGSGYGVVLLRRQATLHGFVAVSRYGYGYGDGAAMHKSRIWAWRIAAWSPDMDTRCLDKDNGAAANGIWPWRRSTGTWIQEFGIIADSDMEIIATDGAGINL